MALTDEIEMSFGAHKGKKLKDVPVHYLIWLKEQIEEKSKLHWTLTDKLFHKYIINVLPNEDINKTNSNTTNER